jgi:hypothetical protein
LTDTIFSSIPFSRSPGSFKIVPVLIGSLSTSRQQFYGRLFANYIADPSNLFVISSDFCHWGVCNLLLFLNYNFHYYIFPIYRIFLYIYYKVNVFAILRSKLQAAGQSTNKLQLWIIRFSVRFYFSKIDYPKRGWTRSRNWTRLFSTTTSRRRRIPFAAEIRFVSCYRRGALSSLLSGTNSSFQAAEYFRQMNNHTAEMRFLKYAQSNKVIGTNLS